jgi:hypothetical protein
MKAIDEAVEFYARMADLASGAGESDAARAIYRHIDGLLKLKLVLNA